MKSVLFNKMDMKETKRYVDKGTPGAKKGPKGGYYLDDEPSKVGNQQEPKQSSKQNKSNKPVEGVPPENYEQIQDQIEVGCESNEDINVIHQTLSKKWGKDIADSNIPNIKLELRNTKIMQKIVDDNEIADIPMENDPDYSNFKSKVAALQDWYPGLTNKEAQFVMGREYNFDKEKLLYKHPEDPDGLSVYVLGENSDSYYISPVFSDDDKINYFSKDEERYWIPKKDTKSDDSNDDNVWKIR